MVGTVKSVYLVKRLTSNLWNFPRWPKLYWRLKREFKRMHYLKYVSRVRLLKRFRVPFYVAGTVGNVYVKFLYGRFVDADYTLRTAGTLEEFAGRKKKRRTWSAGEALAFDLESLLISFYKHSTIRFFVCHRGPAARGFLRTMSRFLKLKAASFFYRSVSAHNGTFFKKKRRL